jgi:hypothetical protein
VSTEGDELRALLISALDEKLGQLGKMAGHLAYTMDGVSPLFPRATLKGLPASDLERLAALKGRFGEMQDHLGAAMKLVARIENVDAAVFTYVLSLMERIGAIPSLGSWELVRDLRNKAAHAYDDDSARQAQIYNDILDQTSFLFHTLDALKSFSEQTYAKDR